jgi:predicted nucleic acid-binding protein
MPVSNTSPLIHLARLGKLGYAKQVFVSIVIPPAVRSEAIDAGKNEGYSDAIALERLESEGWLRTSELSKQSRELAVKLSDAIGIGEAEAIALAVERKERLFMDDLNGRRIAGLYRIETTTTLGLLLELLAAKALTTIDYQKNVKNYGSQGWISADIIQEFTEVGKQFE